MDYLEVYINARDGLRLISGMGYLSPRGVKIKRSDSSGNSAFVFVPYSAITMITGITEPPQSKSEKSLGSMIERMFPVGIFTRRDIEDEEKTEAA